MPEIRGGPTVGRGNSLARARAGEFRGGNRPSAPNLADWPPRATPEFVARSEGAVSVVLRVVLITDQVSSGPRTFGLQVKTRTKSR